MNTTSSPTSAYTPSKPRNFDDEEGADTLKPALADTRVITYVGFALIAYFLVGGGPSGLELSVIYAGPLPCFIAFLVLPIVWSLPQALITAELSCMMPGNGGSILWLTASFGDIGGWIVGVNSLASSLIDLSLYPMMFASYAVAMFGHSPSISSGTDDDSDAAAAAGTPALEVAVRLAVIAIGFLVNIRGIDAVSRFSGVVIALVMTPFAISFVLQLPALWSGGYAWAEVRSDPSWALFTASMLWAHSGWNSCGSFAGEVVNPERTFVVGTLLTMLMVLVTYFLPLLLAVQTHPDFLNWQVGALQTFCGDVFPLLGTWAVGAGLLSQLAMFTSGLSASSRNMWALSGGEGAGAVAHLPKALSREWLGVPFAALAAQAVTVALLTMLHFETLLQCNLALGSVRILMEAAAFLSLRYSRPDAPRPYRACGSTRLLTAIVIAAPLFIVSTSFMALTHGGVWATVGGLNTLGLCVFFARAARDARRYGRWWPRGRCNLVATAGADAGAGGGKDTSPSAKLVQKLAHGGSGGGGGGARNDVWGSGNKWSSSSGWRARADLRGGDVAAVASSSFEASRGLLPDGAPAAAAASSSSEEGGVTNEFALRRPEMTFESARDSGAAAVPMLEYGATAPLSPMSPPGPLLSPLSNFNLPSPQSTGGRNFNLPSPQSTGGPPLSAGGRSVFSDVAASARGDPSTSARAVSSPLATALLSFFSGGGGGGISSENSSPSLREGESSSSSSSSHNSPALQQSAQYPIGAIPRRRKGLADASDGGGIMGPTTGGFTVSGFASREASSSEQQPNNKFALGLPPIFKPPPGALSAATVGGSDTGSPFGSSSSSSSSATSSPRFSTYSVFGAPPRPSPSAFVSGASAAGEGASVGSGAVSNVPRSYSAADESMAKRRV